VNVITGHRPAVLVIDDVQWADATSLDVLSYLLAGVRAQRLLVLITLRDDELGEGELLHGWLADVLRLPALRELRLSRMTPDETAEQLRLLLRREPDPELVGEISTRTGGNPYFTELLAATVDPGTGRLPGGLPVALQAALAATWHRMSSPAREATRWLAVAGRPTTSELLARVAGLPHVAAALREARDTGVIEPAADRVWFRHPLLAEVLAATLLPDERAARHRAFAAALAASSGADPRDLAALALHHEAAGCYDEAFEACFVAADAAAAVPAYAEESALRARAARMCSRVSPAVRDRHGSEAAICRRAAFQARRAGDETAAYELLLRAREVLHEEPDPVERGLVLWLVALMERDMVGTDSAYGLLSEAAALCRGSPRDLALVLAELGIEEFQRGDLAAARRCADEAVDMARASGDAAVESYVLGARGYSNARTPQAEKDARDGYALAQSLRQPEWQALAAIELANVVEQQGRWTECAELMLEAHRGAALAGILGMTQLTGAYAGRFLSEVGRLDDAEQVLRQVLSTRAVGLAGNQARQAAVMVCLRQGRMREADAHLDRLRELVPGFPTVPAGAYGVDVFAEHCLAHDRPGEALASIGQEIGHHAKVDPGYADLLLVLAARAAGDLVERSVTRRAEGRDGLQRAVQQREAAGPPFTDAGANPVIAAWQAVYLAERDRFEGDSQGRPELWREAVESAAAAGLVHEQCRTTLALARRLLSSRSGRAEGTERLRAANALARRMGAVPLVQQARSLARLARVSLDDPVQVVPGVADARGLLTPREQEVLGHLVAGRTYGEIAHDLVISEKTVSVHVSNLLRKTGAANRVEAAVWAERHGITASPPPG
jgi:DNA-binding CsgD family transcriptional regulator/tetratricopeptide (TPR) repeat protein